ncbi:hypothetical protein [uncultured Pseudoteredinibacter sp.]|uniref:hypothetical protein n=1 Tax=uncultured Pseudoteredinibacter sp. TaxID=1641701 RepID=UPI00260D006B|nr:hypothetical protein [uncultured Pseudoteredinibacter sp.]
MNITWTSKQGSKRKLNSDAVAIAYVEQYLIAIIVDAAEREFDGRLLIGINDKGKRLAQHWADSCLCDIVSHVAYTDENVLIDILRSAQSQLRKHYLHDIASYGLLILNRDSYQFDWWFTGDCRVGTYQDQCEINWLNTPHRLVNQTFINGQNSHKTEGNASVQNQLLTRSLNAKRFSAPEKVSSCLDSTQGLVLATDGYWCEHLFQGGNLDDLEDDASRLMMSQGNMILKNEADTPNLFVCYKQ